MFLQKIQKLKLPVILITLSVLALGFSCGTMFGHSSMHMPASAMTSVMPLNSQQECCNTGISKHFEQWQNVLLAAPKEMRDGLILLLIGLGLAFFASRLQFSREASERLTLAYRLYERDNPDLALFNHLKLAFARGILNPKVF